MADTGQERLLLQVGELQFAIDLAQVREVVLEAQITEVPRAPAGIVGIAPVRGNVVTIVDPRHALGLAAGESRAGGRIVLVDLGDEEVGLLVDRAVRVVEPDTASVEEPPPLLDPALLLGGLR